MAIREVLVSRQDNATAAIRRLLTKADAKQLRIAGKDLFDEDILRLCYVDGLITQSWYSSSLINAFIGIVQRKSPADTFVDIHSDVWFEQEEAEIEAALAEASGSGVHPPTPPLLGWRFADLTTAHSRITGSINPSGSYWITYEVELGDHIRVIRYDSTVVRKEKGPTFRAITRILPKLLRLASLRPGSPLVKLDLSNIEQLQANCIR
ncbi:hypothetical protein E8E12_008771 [Didymella heteroderae]|uniref:Uncharacterized protein n=1 Tax=Didymella heteroderae TaxID=1769908 RepID=A0A9P4WXE9_9PLEO|nr:hypothetical protein E8E12_008771 [Didymella heteroderae]